MPTLPPYISDLGHGESCFPAPITIDQVTSYSFVLEADMTKLQAFVDSRLNVVGGKLYRYTVLPFLFHCYLTSPDCTSTISDIGYLPDQESAFLVPLLEWKTGDLLPRPKIWVPYLFIDSPSGLITGREVWGFHKAFAQVSLPASPQQPDAWSAATTIFPTFSPQTAGVVAPLLQLRRLNTAASAAIRANPEELSDYPTARRSLFKRAMREFEGPLAALAADVLDRFVLDTAMPCVNLKQVRDIADSTRACYQALVDAPVEVTTWRNAGWLDDPFELEITTCASHRIVDDLGLKATPAPNGNSLVSPRFAIWAEFDFATLPGSVLLQTS